MFRRKLAAYTRTHSSASWPIKYATKRAPEGWPGWPAGKSLAFVLSHDVEGPVGLARCEQLAALERDLGFRSSFNFIPEGDYSTPAALRHRLASAGFEVGVHDLHHDGKLYRSQANFDHAASRINHYLKEWGAVGFRSGFMHHNLDWLHGLDIAYDMSTFDTDPFEPQPDGADTIFPFWVPNPSSPESPAHNSPFTTRHSPSEAIRHSRGGYVELPYTLPQDSTLFIALEEETIDIWKQKLDWIAQHGGMALVNVHPDYINFNGKPAYREYPVALYAELLSYARERYGSSAWFALPREVAAYCSRFRPPKPVLSSRRVCMVSYSFYESDNRVMRYAEALTDRGDSVEVLALAKSDSAPRHEAIEGVSLSRLQTRQRNEKGKFNYLARILRFLCHSSLVLSWRHLRRKYDVIHIHNVPDFLIFAAWFPKLTGARILLDIHDILPEFFVSKFGGRGETDWYFDQLLRLEAASCKFADHVIIANHLWYDKITRRSVPPEKCSVILNFVDSKLFSPRPRNRSDDRLIAIFPGGLQEHQGLDIAIRAFGTVVKEFPTAEFHIYGDGNMKEPWIELARELGLQKHVRFFDPLPIREVVEKVANADLGLVPKRADSFGNEAYSTKIMEFMALGVPVIASRTKIDEYYFNDELVTFFESSNTQDLAEKVRALFRSPSAAKAQVGRGFAHVAANTWSLRRHDYFLIVDGCEWPSTTQEQPSDPGTAPRSRSTLAKAPQPTA